MRVENTYSRYRGCHPRIDLALTQIHEVPYPFYKNSDKVLDNVGLVIVELGSDL